MNDMEIN